MLSGAGATKMNLRITSKECLAVVKAALVLYLLLEGTGLILNRECPVLRSILSKIDTTLKLDRLFSLLIELVLRVVQYAVIRCQHGRIFSWISRDIMDDKKTTCQSFVFF